MRRVVFLIACFILVCLLGFLVYHYYFENKNTDYVEVYAQELTIDSLSNEEGLIFTLSKYSKDKKFSDEIEVYKDGSYNTYSYNCTCRDNSCMYNKTLIDHGLYEYNLLPIFGLQGAQRLEEVKKEYDGEIPWRLYDITAGNGTVYISNDNNYPLNKFLKLLDFEFKDAVCENIQE
ncbi:MAG: hypothetical protein E7159_02350 [Firmicutes bacterium]|nr:hypothetical protein [Bacillota bacterium]